MAEDKKDKKGKAGSRQYRSGKMCPKCGSRMGEHADRHSCGRCGYTEFKTKKAGA